MAPHRRASSPRRWDVDGLLGDDAHLGAVLGLRRCSTTTVGQLMARFRDHARAELEAFGTAPDRFGLVHGDFLPENLLVGPTGASRCSTSTMAATAGSCSTSPPR